MQCNIETDGGSTDSGSPFADVGQTINASTSGDDPTPLLVAAVAVAGVILLS